MSRLLLFLEEHPLLSALILASIIMVVVVLSQDTSHTAIKVTPVWVGNSVTLVVEGNK